MIGNFYRWIEFQYIYELVTPLWFSNQRNTISNIKEIQLAISKKYNWLYLRNMYISCNFYSWIEFQFIYSLVRLVWQNTEELISRPFTGLYIQDPIAAPGLFDIQVR